MRFIYNNTEKPANAARSLKKAVENLSNKKTLSECKDIIAVLTGYKDWSELVKVTTQQLPPSALDEEVASQTLVEQRLYYQAALLSHILGIEQKQALGILESLRLTSRYPRDKYLADGKSAQTTEQKEPQTTEPLEVLVMQWEESERGWGTRPDGYSIHKTERAYHEYQDKQSAYYEKEWGDSVPDEYSRPVWNSLKKITLDPKKHESIIRLLDKRERFFHHEKEVITPIEQEVLAQTDQRAGWFSMR